MSLLTAAEVMTWVPQAANNEQLVAEAIDRAEAIAGDYCGRTLGSTDHDEYYTIGTDQQVIVLRHAPITAVTQVDEDARDDSPTTLTSSQYYYDADAGLLIRDDAYWTAGIEAVRVQYTAGYTSSTVPEGLKQALLQLVAWLMEMRGNVGVTQESIDGYNVTYAAMHGPVPKDIAAMLNPYRRVVAG